MQEAIREEMHGAIREQMQQHILEKEEMQEQIILMQKLVNQLMTTQGYDPMFSITTNARKVKLIYYF
ncbi:hypothetical protein IFM89_017452 [Coptis chinensis]|uniref:Uncharacterized protein n=1 Tax=Coptis chinensis TaxID=261450 RepID=A0A835HZ37_9MAGN|nr:hypothetical protein IFM89_017452 [Coptis chinensis]